ncbi:MAG: protein translocase subunit SecF [Treponema sp.]|jgi:preprotein translocase subunit SecF|nr:protein translocase subunit SecF [Treponema sp.]
MKRIVQFSRAFVPAVVFSIILILVGLFGFFTKGFNLGIDFQSGLIQEVQFAPASLSLTYSGTATASVSMTRNQFDVVLSGVGEESITHSFPYAQYSTVDSLLGGLSAIEGLSVNSLVPGNTETSSLIQSARGDSRLGAEPYIVHYLVSGGKTISIEEVRSSLVSLGNVSVQILGDPADRKFMIRIDEEENAASESVPAELLIETLESNFGKGEAALISSSYVSSRFSQNLASQAGWLIAATLVLILIYASIRFRPQYAIGAVLAILHDALIMVGFIVWTRMEFNTTTIAAILTILGYSINDTIVIFDRIRENKRLFPDDKFVLVLNRSLSETLGRTIITTVTTMLAVLSLFIFTTGSMKDFALALMVGMISGVYSTIFIASGFVNFWDKHIGSKKKTSAVVVEEVKA